MRLETAFASGKGCVLKYAGSHNVHIVYLLWLKALGCKYSSEGLGGATPGETGLDRWTGKLPL